MLGAIVLDYHDLPGIHVLDRAVVTRNENLTGVLRRLILDAGADHR